VELAAIHRHRKSSLTAALTGRLRFAGTFRQHPWWQRLPSFGRLQPPAAPTSRRLTAALTIAALVILPLAAEGHFIRRFHDEGKVYVQTGKFGLDGAKLKAAGHECDLCTVHWCEHPAPEGGRYALVSAANGAAGGYWNNAYHYGRRVTDCNAPNARQGSATYFPILQPLVVMALTLFSAVLAAIALWRIFRPATNMRLTARSRRRET